MAKRNRKQNNNQENINNEVLNNNQNNPKPADTPAAEPKKHWYEPVVALGKKAAPVARKVLSVTAKSLVVAGSAYTIYKGFTSNKGTPELPVIDVPGTVTPADPEPLAIPEPIDIPVADLADSSVTITNF